MFSDKEKETIATAILNRIKKYKCPMCGGESFSIVEEYGLQNISIFNENGIAHNTIGTPFIMLICSNCGFMSKHNMFSLGLMDDSKLNMIKNADKMTNRTD